MATNPNISQGTLNRVRASIIIPGIPTLNISSFNMGKNFVTTKADGDYTLFLETGTGTVRSPEPYILFTIVVDLLRTQALSNSWLAQAQATTILGDVHVHPDVASYPSLHFRECAIQHYEPGDFNGQNASTPLVIKGTFNINNNLWNFN